MQIKDLPQPYMAEWGFIAKQELNPQPSTLNPPIVWPGRHSSAGTCCLQGENLKIVLKGESRILHHPHSEYYGPFFGFAVSGLGFRCSAADF